MIQKILVKSAADCQKYAEDRRLRDRYIVISIRDERPEDLGPRFAVSDRCLDVLTLQFGGTQEPDRSGKPFTREQARRIIDFVERYREKADALLIHCHGAQARALGVGAFVTKMLGGNNYYYFRRRNPDMAVYDILMEEYGEEHPARPPQLFGKPRV